MVLFKKMRPRRGSLAVSIIWGSPIAASSRSAELAYRIGSPRHDSRYSAIDISVSLRASKDRAKALNRESLYMIPLLIWSAALLALATCYHAAGALPHPVQRMSCKQAFWPIVVRKQRLLLNMMLFLHDVSPLQHH